MNIAYLDLGKTHESIKEELDRVYRDIMERQWFIHGEWCGRFEREFAAYCGVANCIGVGNGLDAIRLILQAMDIGAGDEVIVPANTFIATVLAVTYVGASPVFVDADPHTYNLDLKKVEEKITSRTKAVIAVHLYGQIVNMEALWTLQRKYGFRLIEDAAQSHGAIYKDKKAGTLSDAAAFSFYPGKNLGALGDGGAVVTNDAAVAERVRALSNYGSREKYVHLYKGCNSRLDEIQAGFLSKKLPFLDSWNEQRRRIAAKYCNQIKNQNIRLPEWNGEASHVFHIFPVMCKRRDILVPYLAERGIGTNIHYPTPIYMQGAYQECSSLSGSYPVTEKICAQEVSLPLYPGLADEEVEYVIECLNEFKL